VIPIFTRARFKPMVRTICPLIAACPSEDIFDARRNIGLHAAVLFLLFGERTPGEVKAALAGYFSFYNARRPHQSLDYRTPDEMYFGTDEMKKAA
jgi:hypothetical protein